MNNGLGDVAAVTEREEEVQPGLVVRTHLTDSFEHMGLAGAFLLVAWLELAIIFGTRHGDAKPLDHAAAGPTPRSNLNEKPLIYRFRTKVLDTER